MIDKIRVSILNVWKLIEMYRLLASKHTFLRVWRSRQQTLTS